MSKQVLSIEQIEKAAWDYGCEEMTAPATNAPLTKGFVAGAKWRINSVWYGADEVPERSAQCLVEFIDPDFDNEFSRYKLFGFCTHSVGFLGFKKEFKLIRWAYVKDLIPTKEE